MATEFSREFFSENRIVKADLRAAHQLREEDLARIKAEKSAQPTSKKARK